MLHSINAIQRIDGQVKVTVAGVLVFGKTASMPQGRYQNVVWDAAIEHFTPDEIAKIMANIKSRLTPDGILSGYTLVEKEDGSHHLHQHEYEFRDMEDLARFLRPHFKNVRVFETIFPDRHNLHFWASDGIVPFDVGWQHQLASQQNA